MVASDLTSSQQKALLAVAQTCASLSFLGSAFIVTCWLRYQHLRKLSFTLVLWLAVADIGTDITYFMGDPSKPELNNSACTAQASLQQFFQMSQILWTVAIASVLYNVTVNLRIYHDGEEKALMRRFHVFVWGGALVSMLLPFTSNSYGPAGPWCWIKMYPPRVGIMWRYVVLYVPLWVAILYNIRVYVRILQVLRRFSAGIDGVGASGASVGPSAEQHARMAKFMQRLLWYPAVLIIAWTFATINRIYDIFHPSNPIFGLFFMHQMLLSLQGLMNAVVYGSTDSVRSAVMKERCLVCRRGTSDGIDGLDPDEDYVDNTGVRMRDMGDSGPKVFQSGLPAPNDPNDLEDVEIYNAADYTVTV
ncbi:unnamed protein product [Ascophyllum nodosum]